MSDVQQQRAGAIGLDSRRPVRMVCLDVDGTMLGASGTVRDAVWHAVEMARRAGIQLTPLSALSSTARIPRFPAYAIPAALCIPAGSAAPPAGTSIRDIVLTMPSLLQFRCSYQP